MRSATPNEGKVGGHRRHESDDVWAEGNDVRPCSRFLFEGELVDIESLQSRFGALSCTDAGELFSTLFSKEGSAGVAAVDGVFALAGTCPPNTYLYRDPSGLRALYWARAAGEAPAYSTTPLDVKVSTHSQMCLSRDALHEYLRLLDIAAPRTAFHEVQSVESGVLLTISAGNAPRSEVIATHSPGALPSTLDAAVDVFTQMLQHSVAQRIGDAHRVAAFLSGGVDSALICALAARQHSGLTALTVGFDGVGYDEAPVAARIAAHLGLTHEVLRFDRQALLRAFDRLVHGMDQPMADPATMATVLAFDHCRERFDVVLDGTGADEAVGAMPPRHVRLAVEYGSRVPPGLRQLLVRMMSRVPGLASYTPILDFEHPADTMIRWRGFSRPEIESLCGEPVSFGHTQFYRTFAQFPRGAHYERYSALLNAMPCERLTQATQASGMLVRYPFLDRETDRFIRQLPTELKYLPGQPKRILREILARYVPREVWDVPKHGFDFPLQPFLAAADHALVHQHVLAGRWLARGLLRPDAVRRYAQAYIGGDRRLMFRVWALVVLGAWLDAHENLIIAPPSV